MTSMDQLLRNLGIWWRALTPFIQPDYYAGCEHLTKRTGFISKFERIKPVNLDLTKYLPYCLDCLASMSIPCAWCGKGILIDDKVTLYKMRPFNSDGPIDDARKFDEDPRYFIGCTDFECLRCEDDIVGVWVPPGKVFIHPRVLRVLSSHNMTYGVMATA